MAEQQGQSPRRRRPRSAVSSNGSPGDGYGNTGGDGPGDGTDEGGEHREEAVEAHATFVERHFGGGVEATPELLDRASAVWLRLPGAVVRPAGQLRVKPPVTNEGSERR